MNRSLSAASALSTAIGLAPAVGFVPVATEAARMMNPPPVVKQNMAQMQQYHLQKCHGINAAFKND
jgi:hypothetical protein